MPERILVEFITDTDTRSKGARVWVDPKSRGVVRGQEEGRQARR
jgi:hypothetical protein